MRHLNRAALLALLTLSGAAHATLENDAGTLLPYGPRVAGSPANEQARTYLEAQFRALGYDTRRQSFTYSRFDDLGSDVQVAGQTLAGTALQDSAGGTVQAAVVRVPGTGTPEDFARVDVRGKVAVVQRGQIPFLQKAQNALGAGATGVVIVNNAAGDFRGTLGQRTALPVLGVSPTAGEALKDGVTVTLNVRVREGDVTGINLIASRSGQPGSSVLFGAHLDSVQGAPGANDNLSGSLTVLEIARRAATTPLGGRSTFVLFDGEEDGLLGSRAFVKDNTAMVQGLKAMLNFDMVGVNVMPLSISGTPALMDTARRAGLPTAGSDIGRSDHVPFRDAGVPAAMFYRGEDANYHKPGDTVLDLGLVRETADVAVTLADAVLSATPAN
ncbi:Zn-dependent M28 family amino/carboxypeptidase [Deinococcus metalli]|nr:M28 family metallopeptidase [Deinococcus metalli]MBB5377091.1 Zn-dependent M28 family amino/carboxypeptidase [Deinococcus metalli]